MTRRRKAALPFCLRLGGKVNGDTPDYPERTPIDIGPEDNRYLTIYFRNTFQAASPQAYRNLILNLLRDDGAVVYLNGAPVWTNNISAAAQGLAYWTPADMAEDDGTFYQTLSLSPSVLRPGLNTVAVEVHQVGANQAT